MTEEDWLTGANAQPLLEFIGGKMSPRKLRLFAVACCRRLDELFTEDSRQALEVAERLAEGLVDKRTRKRARRNALAAGWVTEPPWLVPHARGPAKQAVQCALAEDPLEAATLTLEVTHQSESALRWNREAHVNRPRSDTPEWMELGERVRVASGIDLSNLLRHIVGAPFRPYSATPSWPADVTRLAEAVYAGADVGFALADALLEAGHPELAEHFRAEAWHPKGCWVVDIITGRK